MSRTNFAHPVATRPEDSTVFVALELSRKSWLVATSSPGEERISKRVVTAGDGPGLLALLGKLRETAERRLGRAVRVVVIQEWTASGCIACWSTTPSKVMSRVAGGGPAQAAPECDRCGRLAARADGLGAPGLLDGSAAEPGGRGPPASVPRA
jgi:hypothetical protein